MKIIVLMLFLTSCASILNDADQKINVTTTGNKKVKYEINGQQYTGPGIVSIKRSKGDKIIQVENPKCTSQYLLKSNIDTKFWLNIFSGGAFGSTTDYATEKMWTYNENVHINCN